MNNDDIQQLREEDEARLDAALHTLSEFFDSVVIIATRTEPELKGTVMINRGRGNSYANYGAAMEYCRNFEDGPQEEEENFS